MGLPFAPILRIQGVYTAYPIEVNGCIKPGSVADYPPAAQSTKFGGCRNNSLISACINLVTPLQRSAGHRRRDDQHLWPLPSPYPLPRIGQGEGSEKDTEKEPKRRNQKIHRLLSSATLRLVSSVDDRRATKESAHANARMAPALAASSIETSFNFS